MEIKRVLNNNTIVAFDKKKEEIVVKGKGIAFGKRVGDWIDESLIEKVFILDNKVFVNQYQELIQDVDKEIVEISEQIIEEIKNHTNKKINDKIYITLTDHVSNLLERISLGINFDSSLLWNVQALYPEEYHLALKSVQMIRNYFHLNIPLDEANFIAIHIVNSEMDVEFQETVGITEVINEVMNTVKDNFPEVILDSNSMDYARFVLHLRFLLQRILKNGMIDYHQSEGLIDSLIETYPYQAKNVEQIIKIISQKYSREIDGEKLFLLIHLIKLTTISH